MQRRVNWLSLFLICLTAFSTGIPIALGGEGFEEVQVAALPRQQFGYRVSLGDIVALNDGRLLATYGPDYLPHAKSEILGRYSSDLGKTWGEPFVLVHAPSLPVPPREKGYYVLPGLTRLANGDVMLSYIYCSQIRPFYSAQTFYRRSIDDGKTWGDQLLLTPAEGSSLGNNDKLIQLKSGRLILPTETEHDESGSDHSGYISRVFYSDDNGYSWRKSRTDVNMLPIDTQEPHVVELKDGRLMMLMRTYSKLLARSYSQDQGNTWSKGELIPTLPISPNSSAINVQRIPKTGDLILLRTTGGTDNRTPFVSTISRDDGETWSHERVIAGDPEDDYGYPSLTFVGDLALVFYHKRDGLYVARIESDWFYGN